MRRDTGEPSGGEEAIVWKPEYIEEPDVESCLYPPGDCGNCPTWVK